MSDDEAPLGVPAAEYEDAGRELRSYVTGYLLALVLTGTAFAIVWLDLASGATALLLLGALALAQAVVHFRYFLHIDLGKSHRDDLLLILFTALIVLLMVGGTIWILYDQHLRMMAPAAP